MILYVENCKPNFSSRYNQLLGIIPSDPGVLQKLGEMYDTIDDKQQAYQFYSDVSKGPSMNYVTNLGGGAKNYGWY